MVSLSVRQLPISLAMVLVTLAASVPLPTSTLDPDVQDDSLEFGIPEDEQEVIEGDIVIDAEIIPVTEIRSVQRQLVSDPVLLWPDHTLYYEFSRGFSVGLRGRVHSALNHLMDHTCVRFLPRTTQSTFLRLRQTGKGCATKVGYQGGAQGGLDLHVGGAKCHTRGAVQHEFLHALGFWHEHTRPDRDKHVSVLWENIRPERKSNFVRRSDNETFSLGLPYDYASVMHYKYTAFTKYKGSPTLVPKVKEAVRVMGQRQGVSRVDIAKLNRLYNCTGGYYRGDDLEGVEVVIGEVEGPRATEEVEQPPDGKDECGESSWVTRQTSKVDEENPGNKCVYNSKTSEDEILDIKKVNEQHVYSMTDRNVEDNAGKNQVKETEFKDTTNINTERKYFNTLMTIVSSQDDRHKSKYSSKTKRETPTGKAIQGGSSEMGAQQQPNGPHESFAPQKILPELLKGVLNNDNDRPIVIQFAFYQPVVYRNSNQTEEQANGENKQGEETSKAQNEGRNEYKKLNDDRKSQGPEQKPETSSSNIRSANNNKREEDSLDSRSFISNEPRDDSYRRPQNEYNQPQRLTETRDYPPLRKEYNSLPPTTERRDFTGPRREYIQSPSVSETREFLMPKQEYIQHETEIYPEISEVREEHVTVSRNEYPPQGGRNEYQSQGGRNEYQPQGGRNEYQPQGGRNEYQSPGRRNEYQPRDEYQQVGGRNEYQPAGERNEYQPQGGRNEYQPVRGRNEYQPAGGRNDYQPQPSPKRDEQFTVSKTDYNPQPKLPQRTGESYTVPKQEYNSPQGPPQRKFSVPRKEYVQPSRVSENSDEYFMPQRKEYYKPPPPTSETRDDRFTVSRKDYSQPLQKRDDYVTAPKKDIIQPPQSPQIREDDYRVQKKEYIPPPRVPSVREEHFADPKEIYVPPQRASDNTRDHFLEPTQEYHRQTLDPPESETRDEHFTVHNEDSDLPRHDPEIVQEHFTEPKEEFHPITHDSEARGELAPTTNEKYSPRPRDSTVGNSRFNAPKDEFNALKPDLVQDEHDTPPKDQYNSPKHDLELKEDHFSTPPGEYSPSVHSPETKDEPFIDHKEIYSSPSHDPETKDDHFRDHKEEFTPLPHESEITDDHFTATKDSYDQPMKEVIPFGTEGPNKDLLKISSSQKDKDVPLSNPVRLSSLLDQTSTENKASRNNNGVIENVNPDWKEGDQYKTKNKEESSSTISKSDKASEEQTTINSHETISEQNITARGDNTEEQLTQEEKDIRAKQKHDLFIKEDFNDELDKEIRKKKIERELKEEYTTKIPEKAVIPDPEEQKQDFGRGKEQGASQKRIQVSTRVSPPKRKASSPKREITEEKVLLESETDLITKPQFSMVNLNPKQALPLNTSVKVGDMRIITIRKEWPAINQMSRK